VTGWRVQSEILRLQWRNVDLKAGTVRLDVGTTKNRDVKDPPNDALLCLLGFVRRTSSVFAFTASVNIRFNGNGRPIKSFRKAWNDACEHTGVSGRIPHDLRRTAVRNLERAGMSRSAVMQLTGHKTDSVYPRYAIVSEADLGEGIAKLATGTIAGTIKGRAKVRRIRR